MPLRFNIPSLLAADSPQPLDPARLKKFVDSLPIPRVLRPKRIAKGIPQYEVTMTAFRQKLHRGLPPTYLWGYNHTYPGPTFEAGTGQPISVKWINHLPTRHFLPVDTNIHGADMGAPAVRAVVHLHGGHVPPESDGYPESWFTPGNSATYLYPNNQPAMPLWYHDHALGITRLNVYAGLAGLYLIRDSAENALNLPRGRQEIPLLIQDRAFNTDGSLFYPVSDLPVSPEHPGPWVPESFGNAILVNGMVWPHLAVEPRKYRFRIYNGSNARFYNLSLSSGQPFFVIGSDGGLLETPQGMTQLLVAPAERVDVVVDFTSLRGMNIQFTNDANAPFPGGDPVDEHTSQVMEFRVMRHTSSRDTSILPPFLRPVPRISESSATLLRDLTLVEQADADDNPTGSFLNGMTWDDPVTESPQLGSTEIWRLINLTDDTHPIHLHLVQFQVLDRQPFDEEAYEATSQIVFTGPPLPPEPNEMGWKDTVRANQGAVTRLIARFTDYAGRYVWHCHILEHEDNDMMRPYVVVAP